MPWVGLNAHETYSLGQLKTAATNSKRSNCLEELVMLTNCSSKTSFWRRHAYLTSYLVFLNKKKIIIISYFNLLDMAIALVGHLWNLLSPTSNSFNQVITLPTHVVWTLVLPIESSCLALRSCIWMKIAFLLKVLEGLGASVAYIQFRAWSKHLLSLVKHLIAIAIGLALRWDKSSQELLLLLLIWPIIRTWSCSYQRTKRVTGSLRSHTTLWTQYLIRLALRLEILLLGCCSTLTIWEGPAIRIALSRAIASEGLRRWDQLSQVWVCVVSHTRYIVFDSQLTQMALVSHISLVFSLSAKYSRYLIVECELALGTSHIVFGCLRNTAAIATVGLNHGLLLLTQDILSAGSTGTLTSAWMAPFSTRFVCTARFL